MSYLSVIFLGILQGITEFLPISSSGHLAIIQSVFHIENTGFFFDAILHLGTLVGIIISFRRDVVKLIAGLFRLSDSRSTPRNGSSAEVQKQMALRIIIGSVPLIPVCFLMGTMDTLSCLPLFVSFMLIINGFILHFTEQYGYGRKQKEELTIADTLIIGICQALSVIPGISRTGITISVGMVRGMSKNDAMTFSFLLSIPAVLFCAVISLIRSVLAGIDVSLLPAYLIALIVTALISIFTIRFLKWVSSQKSWHIFSYYCWGAGIVALILSLVS